MCDESRMKLIADNERIASSLATLMQDSSPNFGTSSTQNERNKVHTFGAVGASKSVRSVAEPITENSESVDSVPHDSMHRFHIAVSKRSKILSLMNHGAKKVTDSESGLISKLSIFCWCTNSAADSSSN